MLRCYRSNKPPSSFLRFPLSFKSHSNHFLSCSSLTASGACSVTSFPISRMRLPQTLPSPVGYTVPPPALPPRVPDRVCVDAPQVLDPKGRNPLHSQLPSCAQPRRTPTLSSPHFLTSI